MHVVEPDYYAMQSIEGSTRGTKLPDEAVIYLQSTLVGPFIKSADGKSVEEFESARHTFLEKAFGIILLADVLQRLLTILPVRTNGILEL